MNVVGRITVTGEDRLVDAQRIGFDIPVADIGVGEECIVENLRQLVVGDDFVAGPGAAQKRRQDERTVSGGLLPFLFWFFNN